MTTAILGRGSATSGVSMAVDVTIGDDLKARAEERLKPFESAGAVEVEEGVHEAAAIYAAAHHALLGGIDVVGVEVADYGGVAAGGGLESGADARHGEAAEVGAGADGEAERAERGEGDGDFRDAIDQARGGAEAGPAVEGIGGREDGAGVLEAEAGEDLVSPGGAGGEGEDGGAETDDGSGGEGADGVEVAEEIVAEGGGGVLVEWAMCVCVAGELVAGGGDGADGIREAEGDLANDEKGAAHAGGAEEIEQTVREEGEGSAAESVLALGGVELLEVDGEEEGFHWKGRK